MEELRKADESSRVYCSYLRDYIEYGMCYDLQMIDGRYIKPDALPEINIDREKLRQCCNECDNHCKSI